LKNISAKHIGIITGILMIAATLILFYIFKFPDTGITKYTSYGIYIAGILLALFLYKKNGNGPTNFKDYFSEGFKVFVIAVLFISIFTFIFYKYNPQILEASIVEINKINSQDPNKTAAEVLENSNKLKNIFIPMTVAINTLLYLILGSILTALGAGFLSQPMLNENK
jgi:hypothetical protein